MHNSTASTRDQHRKDAESAQGADLCAWPIGEAEPRKATGYADASG